jgi:hypothetical protein
MTMTTIVIMPMENLKKLSQKRRKKDTIAQRVMPKSCSKHSNPTMNILKRVIQNWPGIILVINVKVIWVVKFPTEGYKIRCIFDQKSTYHISSYSCLKISYTVFP